MEKEEELRKGLHLHHTEGGKEGKLTMEVEWIADRAALRRLAKPHPAWTQRELADAVGRSLSWMKKWLKRL